MTIEKNVFGTRLKVLRDLKGLTLQKLADELGLKSKGSISQFEKGTNYPSFEILIAIANYFHVSLDYICGRNEENIYAKLEIDMINRISLLETANQSLTKKINEISKGIMLVVDVIKTK